MFNTTKKLFSNITFAYLITLDNIQSYYQALQLCTHYSG
jgi:hypothetical protein